MKRDGGRTSDEANAARDDAKRDGDDDSAKRASDDTNVSCWMSKSERLLEQGREGASATDNDRRSIFTSVTGPTPDFEENVRQLKGKLTPAEKDAYEKHHELVWKSVNEWERMQINFGNRYVSCSNCNFLHHSDIDTRDKHATSRCWACRGAPQQREDENDFDPLRPPCALQNVHISTSHARHLLDESGLDPAMRRRLDTLLNNLDKSKRELREYDFQLRWFLSLPALSMVEEQLLALIQPCMVIVHTKGGKRRLQGNIMANTQDGGKLVKEIPRGGTRIIRVRRVNKKRPDMPRVFHVKRARLLAWYKFLVYCHPDYKDLTWNEQNAALAPEDDGEHDTQRELLVDENDNALATSGDADVDRAAMLTWLGRSCVRNTTPVIEALDAACANIAELAAFDVTKVSDEAWPSKILRTKLGSELDSLRKQLATSGRANDASSRRHKRDVANGAEQSDDDDDGDDDDDAGDDDDGGDGEVELNASGTEPSKQLPAGVDRREREDPSKHSAPMVLDWPERGEDVNEFTQVRYFSQARLVGLANLAPLTRTTPRRADVPVSSPVRHGRLPDAQRPRSQAQRLCHAAVLSSFW